MNIIMRKNTLIAMAFVCGAIAFVGCGVLGTTSASTGNSTATSSASSGTASDALSSILGNLLGTTAATASSIVGTWTYQEPAVQFASENLLAKAGGSIASAKVVQKIEPYYTKLGITKGAVSLTLNEDKTCSYTLKGRTYNGTYVYDESANTITIKGTTLASPTAYVSVSSSQLALTFESTKLLNLVQKAGSFSSSNSSLSTISTIANAYDGMKTGFLFTR